MLRELKKGDKALVIDDRMSDHSEIGEIVTVRNGSTGMPICDTATSGNRGWSIYRNDLLAIGDKVVRGPDMSKDLAAHEDAGKVIGFNYEDANAGFNVRVAWPDDTIGSYRMTADYQDLKPTGDSEGEDLDIGPCKIIINKITHIQEGNMATSNRSARKRELKETIIPQREDTVADAELALAEATDEFARLIFSKTDHAETITDIITVHGLDEKQAEAAYRLSKQGINIAVK